jgi:hypothetical protein
MKVALSNIEMESVESIQRRHESRTKWSLSRVRRAVSISAVKGRTRSCGEASEAGGEDEPSADGLFHDELEIGAGELSWEGRSWACEALGLWAVNILTSPKIPDGYRQMMLTTDLEAEAPHFDVNRDTGYFV